MKKYYSHTYLTYKETLKLKGKYIKQLAIKNNKCFRCGQENITNFCNNCCEFGILNVGDYLYNLDINIKNDPYIKVISELKFTKLQKECSYFLIDNYHNHQNSLVWAVCGAGKTEITFPVIEQALINQKNICFAIPRIDILYEVHERLCQYFPNILIKILNSNEEKYVDAQIYVMTTNQILKFKNTFDLVIVDEVDAYPYEHNQKYDYGVKTSLTDTGVVVYLTSTPSDKLKNEKLKTFVIYKRWHNHPLPVPICIYSPLKILDFNLLPILLYFSLYKSTRQQVWFISNIKLAEQLLIIARKYNKNIYFVHANCKKRRETINNFKQKKFNILITTTILERGVTFTDIDVYIIDSSSPLYNKAALIQIAGRVGRNINYQQGKVYFLHQGYTKLMEKSIKEIKSMNEKI